MVLPIAVGLALLLIWSIASWLAWGFVTAVITAVPLGLVIGRHAAPRAALLPRINFFRSLSPIAWITTQ